MDEDTQARVSFWRRVMAQPLNTALTGILIRFEVHKRLLAYAVNADLPVNRVVDLALMQFLIKAEGEAEDTQRRQAVAQVATKPIAGPTVVEPAPPVPPAHEHSYAVVTSSLTSIRYCVNCGETWIMRPGTRHFNNVSVWTKVYED